jgi:hypothetical protein
LWITGIPDPVVKWTTSASFHSPLSAVAVYVPVGKQGRAEGIRGISERMARVIRIFNRVIHSVNNFLLRSWVNDYRPDAYNPVNFVVFPHTLSPPVDNLWVAACW